MVWLATQRRATVHLRIWLFCKGLFPSRACKRERYHVANQIYVRIVRMITFVSSCFIDWWSAFNGHVRVIWHDAGERWLRPWLTAQCWRCHRRGLGLSGQWLFGRWRWSRKGLKVGEVTNRRVVEDPWCKRSLSILKWSQLLIWISCSNQCNVATCRVWLW